MRYNKQINKGDFSFENVLGFKKKLTKNQFVTKSGFIFAYTILLLFLWSNCIMAQGMTIVRNQVPKASIIISPKADSQIIKAAVFLQKVIERSTRATLPIVTNLTENEAFIHIGQTNFVQQQNLNLSQLDEDGFLLKKADSKNFIIVGGSEWGTEFGVYAFLEKFVGVVNLMPGDIGFDIPPHTSLVLPDVAIVDNPVYLSRQISPIDITANYPLGNWGRFNRLRGRIFFHHNLLNLFNPKEYFKTNPDFYPLINNKREIPKGYKWQPNFSAPGIADSASQKIIHYFTQNPSIPSYSLSINDYSIFDQSAASLFRRNGKKNLFGFEDVSNDYFEWANKVARKVTAVFPSKKFGVLAYENVATPPSANIGVDSHVVPFLTYERMRWSDSTLKKQGQQLTKGWTNLASSLGWYDYTYGLDYLTPRIWFHEMQDYLIWGSNNKVKYYYAELYPNWGEGPKPWIQSKILWNPRYNVDSLLNIWYVRMAGEKAAPNLKEFYAIWEKFWTHDIFLSKWNTNQGQYLNFNNLGYLGAVPKEYVDDADHLMISALRLAGSDLQKRRVRKLSEMWNLYRTAIEIYNDPNIPENQKQRSLTASPQFIGLLNALSTDPLFSDTVKWIEQQLNIKS